MSMSQYIWAVARGLRTQVHPAVNTSQARDALDNSIRVLTIVANALEMRGAEAVPTPEGYDALVDTDRLRGPAENAAAYRESGAAIAACAHQLNKDGARATDHRAAVKWEKSLLDAGIARMDEIERAAPAPADDPRLSINRYALESYLRLRCGDDSLHIEEFRPILGGRSRQTALFSIGGTDRLPQKMVVQRGIPGGGSGTNYASEEVQYELLDTLHRGGLRVPRPVLFENDHSPLGASFLLTEQVNGTPAQADYWLPLKNETVALDLAREMALLHRLPLGTLGPKLTQSRERYDIAGWKEELESQASQWNQSAHWPSVNMSAAIAWLRANVDCLEDRRSFVHNDMIFHNILADQGQITAVLDWEQTSVGHPGEDLGYAYPVVCAATEWARFLDAYHEAGGPPVTQRQIDYFALRAGLRLMNLVLKGGRDAFENGYSQDVLVASAGAHFTQRLLHRIASVVESVLERA